MLSVLMLAAALAAGPAAPAPPADPGEVVAAERAFAADGLALGLRDSFLKHAAPDGLLLAPGPTPVREAFAPPAPPGPALVWWPLWAGISRSGDLGFTTGPYSVGGKPRAWYFTVWGRQPDGTWKWLIDAGPPSSPQGAAPQGSAVAYARPAARASGDRAMSEVAAAEAALAAAPDPRAATLALLADDGRAAGSRAAPPADRGSLEAELATRPAALAYAPLGGGASRAGDLAWTYGSATWTGGAGHYVRVWRNDAEGWRLLFDELLEDRPPS